jgi:hypothetical protein
MLLRVVPYYPVRENITRGKTTVATDDVKPIPD